jgi:hypothetical protein
MEHPARWWLGLAAAIATALAGANLDISEPYRTWLSIGGIAGTATIAYLMKPPELPRDPRRRDRRFDRRWSRITDDDDYYDDDED